MISELTMDRRPSSRVVGISFQNPRRHRSVKGQRVTKAAVQNDIAYPATVLHIYWYVDPEDFFKLFAHHFLLFSGYNPGP